ncbi:atherin-like isoform X1 [Cavia porcellus]|uniref:atherin-like isoform X1 n=1 Tax=Cavia porcellus TaxID=10141 RepID=UPI002FE37A6F
MSPRAGTRSATPRTSPAAPERAGRAEAGRSPVRGALSRQLRLGGGRASAEAASPRGRPGPGSCIPGAGSGSGAAAAWPRASPGAQASQPMSTRRLAPRAGLRAAGVRAAGRAADASPHRLPPPFSPSCPPHPTPPHPARAVTRREAAPQAHAGASARMMKMSSSWTEVQVTHHDEGTQ